MIKETEVVFVYIGDSLPQYGKASLNLAIKQSGLNVRLIGSETLINGINSLNINFTSLESFYDPNRFLSIANKILLPEGFRNGFWLKTLERFYVIQQFMDKFELEQIFHAELDQLLFGCDRLISKIQSSKKKGLFLPFHTINLGVASVLYCNDIDSLISFTNFPNEINEFQNEMSLLGLWAKQNPNLVNVLPTLANELNGTSSFQKAGVTILDSETLGGVVDAAQLGQWVGGVDPRNLPINLAPSNLFCEDKTDDLISRQQFTESKFLLREPCRLVWSSSSRGEIEVYNLHLHSKIHSWIIKSDNLARLLELSNNNILTMIPSSRRIQISHFLSIGFKSFQKNPIQVLRRLLKLIVSKFRS